MNFNIIHINECDSTNAYLQRLIMEGDPEEGTVISTSFQTKGRGQLTNVWEAEAGQNILCSILLRPTKLPIKSQFLISQAISVAIVDVLNSYTDGFSIKWPNDIYYKEDKIAGILIENNLTSAGISTCIIGLGLNVNQKTFKSDAPNPISLFNIIGRETSVPELLQGILERFDKVYSLVYSNVGLLRENYFTNLLFNGQMREYADENGIFLGKIVDVENDGRLIIEDMEGGKRRYAFKQVTFLSSKR
ncbi:MAG: biotin--[acetyl-CoA-carboxylase] ligase [Paludibacteraceae bacterium]|nr:biotin--[acetyl-CoA-carboxylase] ligase [Paludibacteraceae bacterium]